MTEKPTRTSLVPAAAILAAMGVFIFVMLITGRNARPTENIRSGALRVVSLAPSVTEIVFALDLGNCLVGATEHCNWPPQARRIERVGGLGKPNVERLLALRPDLIIAADTDRKETVEALRRTGLRVLAVRIRNFEELFAAITDIGCQTARASQAERLVGGMRLKLDAVARRYGHIPPQHRPRVFLELWHQPLATAGGTSFLNDLIARAGGINVAGGLTQPHPRVNPENVIQWNPDVIVVAYMGRSGQAALPMADRIGWAEVKAVRSGRIIDDIPTDLLLRPGPRLIEGVEVLAQRLHPSSPERHPLADRLGKADP